MSSTRRNGGWEAGKERLQHNGGLEKVQKNGNGLLEKAKACVGEWDGCRRQKYGKRGRTGMFEQGRGTNRGAERGD